MRHTPYPKHDTGTPNPLIPPSAHAPSIPSSSATSRQPRADHQIIDHQKVDHHNFDHQVIDHGVDHHHNNAHNDGTLQDAYNDGTIQRPTGLPPLDDAALDAFVSQLAASSSDVDIDQLLTGLTNSVQVGGWVGVGVYVFRTNLPYISSSSIHTHTHTYHMRTYPTPTIPPPPHTAPYCSPTCSPTTTFHVHT